MIELKEKLMKARYESITAELIDEMIIDIRKYLVNKEKFTTNQQYISMRMLFRGYTVKN